MSNEQAFNAAVNASEGVKQAAVAAAKSQSETSQAFADHHQRCAEAADLHGMSATVYLDALAFRARGV